MGDLGASLGGAASWPCSLWQWIGISTHVVGYDKAPHDDSKTKSGRILNVAHGIFALSTYGIFQSK